VVLFAISVRRSEDGEIRRNLVSATAEVAQLLAPSMWDLDMDRAASIAEAFAQDPRVVRLTIHESGGAMREIRHDVVGDRIWRREPVVYRGRVLGDVELVFSRALYAARVRQQVIVAIGVGALVLLVTLTCVALLRGRFLRRPLDDLTATVQRYADGDYTPR